MVARVVFAVLVVCCVALVARADEPVPSQAEVKSTYGTGEKVCGKLSLAALVGQSPWLVMGVGGAVNYFDTPDEGKDKLGLFAQPWAWGTMLVLVLLVAFKDTVLTVFSQLKLPLDALAQAFHALGAVFGIAYLGVSAFGGEAAPDPSAAPTFLDQVGHFLLWLLMCGVHFAVWVVFNTFEVAILFNPVPFVDTCLKAFRTAVIGAIAAAAAIHPVFGFSLALPVILVCVCLVPVGVRLAVVGGVFTVDVFRRLFGYRPPPGAPVRAFTTLGFKGVPVGTFGTVQRGGGGLEFVYRPAFILWKRRVPIPWERTAVASGGVLPRLVELGEDGRTWLRFPPRYRKMEPELALALGLGDVVRKSDRDSFGRAVRRTWDWVRGRRDRQAEATA